jgi:hypothetical protein
MTTLGTIQSNHLSLTCRACGHNALVAVAGLLNTIPPDTTVQQVRQQARCSRCKVKGMNDCQTIFVGGSLQALKGSQSAKQQG